MKIDIPFKDQFKSDMILGNKVCTSRNKKYGNTKDTFQRWDAKFMLVAVPRLPLKIVAECLYREEGFFSPEDFINIWNELHPRKGFDPEQLVYVHFFIKI